MIFVAVAALAGRPMHVPPPFARVIFVLIGISLGGAVTPETLKGVATWPLSVVLLCLAMTSATFGSAFYLKKVHGWDMLSALFGAAPGALSQVMVYATQYHADLRGIAIVQSVRAAILIACVPGGLALAGLMPSGPPLRSLTITDSISRTRYSGGGFERDCERSLMPCDSRAVIFSVRCWPPPSSTAAA